MLNKLQKKFALSRQGTIDLIKACIACAVSYLILMPPVGLLYFFVSDIMHGTLAKIPLYIIGVMVSHAYSSNYIHSIQCNIPYNIC